MQRIYPDTILIHKMNDVFIYEDGKVKKVRSKKDSDVIKTKLPENRCWIMAGHKDISEKSTQTVTTYHHALGLLVSANPLNKYELREVKKLTGCQPEIVKDLNPFQKLITEYYVEPTKLKDRALLVLNCNSDGVMTKDKYFLCHSNKEKVLQIATLPDEKMTSEYYQLELIDALLKWQRKYLIDLDIANADLQQIPIRIVNDTAGNLFCNTNISMAKLKAMQSNLSMLFSKLFSKKLACVYFKNDFLNLYDTSLFEKNMQSKSFTSVPTLGLTMAQKYPWDLTKLTYRYSFNSFLDMYMVQASNDIGITKKHVGRSLDNLFEETALDALGSLLMNPKFTRTSNAESNGFKVNVDNVNELIIPDLNRIGFHIVEVN
ncbi:MAG: hypothetical protein ABF786_08845 [Oenococcus oeni]